MRKCIGVMVLALCLGTAWAEPGLGSYFLVVQNGTITAQSGSGYGGQFYYYPQGGWYNMWWGNTFAPDYQKRITINFSVFVSPGQPQPEVCVNWSDELYTNFSVPPMPGQDQFIHRSDLVDYSGGAGSYTFDVITHCPQWVSVDVRGGSGGSNSFIFSGTIEYECLEPGACCYGDNLCSCDYVNKPACDLLGGEFHLGVMCDEHPCDNEAPVFAVPADATVECTDVPQAQSIEAVDNCDGIIAIEPQEAIESGPCPGSYTITRTWTAIDSANNSTTKTQTIWVQDTIPPTLSGCPADAVVNCEGDLPDLEDVAVTASDNCLGDVVITRDQVRVDIANSCCAYQLVRTWTATDACGLTSSCTQTVTVEDTVAPEINVQKVVTPISECMFEAEFTIEVTDNCCIRAEDVVAELAGSGNVTYFDKFSEGGPVWITLKVQGELGDVVGVLVFAVDCCGNHATTAEALSEGRFSESWAGGGEGAPGNVVHAWSDQFIAQWELLGPTAVSTVLISPSLPPGGTGELVYKTTYTGGTIVLTGQYSAPLLTYIHYTHVPYIAGEPQPRWTCAVGHAAKDAVTGVTFTALAEFDGSGLGFPGSPYPPFLPPLYNGPGGWGKVTQLRISEFPLLPDWQVTLSDDSPPTILCPADVAVGTDASSCFASVALGEPVTGDNCGVADVDNDAPNTFPPGQTPVTWTVTDVNGNTATCTQLVVVTDNEPPVLLTWPDNPTMVAADPGQCTKQVDFNATASDNCEYTISFDPPSGHAFGIGDTLVTCTARDLQGNIDTQSFTVTVTDPNALILGACCVGEVCQQVSQCDCVSYGGTWTEDSACDPTNPCLIPRGSCCMTDGTCVDNLTEDECEAENGDWTHNSTCQPNLCPQPGACVYEDGHCEMLTELGGECGEGGTYLGDGSVCEGACCYDDGSCALTLRADCDGLSFKGADTNCSGPNPSLTLTTDEPKYVEGDTVTVTLAMEDICSDVVGGDFYVMWDPAVLQFESANPKNMTEFGESSEVVGSGTLAYSVFGVGFPPFEVTGDYAFAELEFKALQTICDTIDLVEWQSNEPPNPPNRLSDTFGQPVTPALIDVPATGGNMLELQLNVELDGEFPMDPNYPYFERCIHFELWTCSGAPPVPLDEVMQFYPGANASRVAQKTVWVDCNVYTCITAQDELHTLRRTADDSDGGNFINDEGEPLVANFVGDPDNGGDALIGGNLNAKAIVNDNWIDILDFGVFSWKYGSEPGANTHCSTGYPHADVNGDGTVEDLEFSFIFDNYKKSYEDDCCGTALRGDQGGPITRITVSDLVAQGMGELAAGDLNGDGWLDEADMAAFGSGVPPVRAGDLNCDGAVSFADINAFVQAITDPSGWQAAHPGCNPLNGDANNDGSVNFGDINPFIALLQR